MDLHSLIKLILYDLSMITIAPFRSSDIAEMGRATIAINKAVAQYQRYYEEQEAGTRSMFVARSDGAVGYVTVNWLPEHPPFRQAGIPEIQDLNVLPRYRRQTIASRLMEEAERVILERSPIIKIGVLC